VPLDSVEAAVTSAVRMGYSIAEAQIDRSARLARRLREAGDRAAGPDSDRQAVDATERLVFRAMMAGVSWLEGIAAEPGSPLKRLAAAEYRILGSLFGLSSAAEPSAPDGRPPARSAGDTDASRPGTSGSAAFPRASRVRVPLRIRHLGQERRAVDVREWVLDAEIPAARYRITFYNVERPADSIPGTLTVRGTGPATLALETSREAVPGLWKAAICDSGDIQVGHIEIAL
jgi:hypothetical protein